MTNDEALRIVTLMAAAHPAWKATEATVGLWCDMLADIDAQVGMAAARRLVATSDEWPSIPALRQEVADMAGLLPPPSEEAVEEVLTAARRFGRRGGGDWSHPVVGEAVQSIGWRTICDANKVTVISAQFRKAYERLADAYTKEHTVPGGTISDVTADMLAGPTQRQLTA